MRTVVVNFNCSRWRVKTEETTKLIIIKKTLDTKTNIINCKAPREFDFSEQHKLTQVVPEDENITHLFLKDIDEYKLTCCKLYWQFVSRVCTFSVSLPMPDINKMIRKS
jgi:6-phosphogluconolactonase (cycloisomerase 2 family)